MGHKTLIIYILKAKQSETRLCNYLAQILLYTDYTCMTITCETCMTITCERSNKVCTFGKIHLPLIVVHYDCLS